MHVLKELTSTRKVISKLSDEDLLNLPRLTDETTISELQLLRIPSSCAFELDHGDLITVSSLRLMRLTCQLGKYTVSPHAFSIYGLVQSSLGNIAEATRFGKLALQSLSQGLDKYFSQRTLIIIWDGCQSAVESGLDVGMTYDLTTVGAMVCVKYLMHGREKLVPALKYWLSFMDRAMVEYVSTSKYMALTKVACQAMMTHSSTAVGMPWLLNGDVMQEDNLLRETKQNSMTLTLYAVQNIKLQLAVYFNNWESALMAADKLAKMGSVVVGRFFISFTI